MKLILSILLLCGCGALNAEVFTINRQKNETVEVVRDGAEYRIYCRFPAQTKFDSQKNARWNDFKGKSLCTKGLMRFCKVKPDETVDVSGLYTLGPVEKNGEMLCYSFAVKAEGCRVVKAPKVKKSNLAVAAPGIDTNGVLAVKQLLEPMGNPLLSEVSQEQAGIGCCDKTNSRGFLSVVKYTDVNGRRKIESKREYSSDAFKHPEEFVELCRREFDRINETGNTNMLKVLKNNGEK
jgi:hypothetical protein